jgi:hypothetical protein
MTTECSQEPFPFHPLNQREVRGRFDGGSITSDAGGLLLREVEKRTNIVGQFASCFTDYRDAELREHAVTELLAQRSLGQLVSPETRQFSSRRSVLPKPECCERRAEWLPVDRRFYGI